MPLERITIFCFGASYAVALALEILQLLWPRPVQRLLSVSFGTAGLLAHTCYLGFHPPALSSRLGSLLLLAWVLAVFYLYGYLHHRKWAWGIFVLPLVLGLVVLAAIDPGPQSSIAWLSFLDSVPQDQVWRILHYGLLILASVGVCVGFLASVMYLFQAHRLKAKLPPGQGIRLPSLERLEEMNQRAINLAFPLLTAGVAIGLLVMPNQALAVPELTDPKILGTAVLWGLFVLLLVLRYAARVRGRRMALLTILAFLLLLLTLASSHTSVQGGAP